MDQWVANWIEAHRTPWLNDLARFLMHVGQSEIAPIVVLAATLLVAVRWRQWAWGAAVAIAAVTATIVAAVAKAVIDRSRPPLSLAMVVAPGSSMPSSVALLCAAMGVAAVFGWERPTPAGRRRAVVVVSAVVLLFGAAVVYLGAHWTSDVLVGWAAGIVVGAVSIPLGRVTAAVVQGWLPGAFAWADRYAAGSTDERPVDVDVDAVGSDAVVDAQEA